MSKVLATINPNIALAVIQEGMQLCQNIMQYKQATDQLELQYKAMNKQADFLINQEKNQHNQQMKRLKIIAKSYGMMIKENCQQTYNIMELIKQCDKNIQQQLMVINSPHNDVTIREQAITTLGLLQTYHQYLLDKYMQSSQDPMNAFVQLTDALRNSPRTFTDIH